MKCSLETQRNLFKGMFVENESVTRTSYKIVKTMVQYGKPFTDGKLIEECMIQAVNESQFVWKYQSFNKFSCAENRTLGEYSVTDTRES